MSNKIRRQFSLRFDNYSELLAEVKFYCHQNKISLTEFTANALQEKLDKIKNNHKKSDIETQLANFKKELLSTCKRLHTVEEQLEKFRQGKN